MELVAGSRVGRYEIVKRLGAGGMGIVYLARDAELDRDVALKLVRPTDGAVDELHARLRREAQAMAKLSHPNVVPVFDTGVIGDRAFIAMGLCDGGTLRAWLEQPRPWRRVVETLVGAARGLAGAHAAGLVHRDFKPDNVLLTSTGEVLVSDFGLVRPIAPIEPNVPIEPIEPIEPPPSLTATGSVAGTLPYMAPEQLLGRPVTPAVDQFAFCVTLYEAVYGVRPFASAPALPLAPALLAEISAGRFQPPRRPAPRWLHRVIARGLALAPADRWPSMTALGHALERGLHRRRRWSVIAAAVLGAVAIGAMVVRVIGDDRETVTTTRAPWTPILVAEESKAMPGNLAAIARDSSLTVFTSGDRLWVQRGLGLERAEIAAPPRTTITWLDIAPDAAHVAAIGNSAASQNVLILDLASGAWRSVYSSMFMESIDYSPDGREILVGQRDGLVAIATNGGATRSVIAGAPGEHLGGARWSPSGQRIVFWRSRSGTVSLELLTVSTGGVAKLLELPRGVLTNSPAWVDERTVLMVELDKNSDYNRVIELALTEAGAVARRQEVFASRQGEPIVQVDTTDRGVFFQTMDSRLAVQRLRLDRAGAVLEPTPVSSSDRSLGGWTTSGDLVVGINAVGTNDIVAVPPQGAMRPLVEGPTADAPAGVVGDDVIVSRAVGDQCQVHRLSRGTLSPPLATTSCVTDIVVCAADRELPCLFGETSGDERTFAWWNPATGERGPVALVEPWPRATADEALSPDGKTLALAKLGAKVELVELATKQRRIVNVGAAIQFVTFGPDGTLYATDAITAQLYAIADGKARLLAQPEGRWLAYPRVSADGKQLAVIVATRHALFYVVRLGP